MKSTHSIVVAVDPGFGGTGLCIFLDKMLYRCFNVKSCKKDTDRYIDISEQCFSIVANAIQDMCINYDIEFASSASIVIESPHAMGGAKGNASLGRGDVFKVAKLAGALGVSLYKSIEGSGGYCQIGRIDLYYPEVRTWKGQVSKETTKRRVLRDIRYFDVHHKFPARCTEHIYDAAGIGLWFINKTIIGAQL